MLVWRSFPTYQDDDLSGPLACCTLQDVHTGRSLMDKFVTRGVQRPNKSHSRQRQRTLHSLRKVVILDAGTTSTVFTDADLSRLQAILQNADSTTDDIVQTLRKLSCLQFSARHLGDLPLLQQSVQILESAVEEDICIAAGRLVAKWTAIQQPTKPSSRLTKGAAYRNFTRLSRPHTSNNRPTSKVSVFEPR